MRSNLLLLPLAALLACLVFPAKADSGNFELMTLRSGSALHFAEILADLNNSEGSYYPLTVGRTLNDTLVYNIDETGHLIANSSLYWTIIPDSEGRYALTANKSQALDGFYIYQGILSLSKNYIFEAVPDGTYWDLYSQNSTGNNGNTVYNLQVSLLAHDSQGFAPDFFPSNYVNDSSVITSSSTSSSASVNTTTLQTTSQTSSSISTSLSTSTTQANSSSLTSVKKNFAPSSMNSLNLLALGLLGLFV